MEQREKLIELITTADDEYVYSDDDKDGTGEIAYIADHLLANGVVVLPCRCGECINRHDEVICPMVISHESFDEDDGYDVWYEDLTTDDFYCANGERKGGDE